MSLSITAPYAAVLALIYIVLAGMVGRARSKGGPSIGIGTDPALLEADRRHMNFVENVPFALLLIAMVELNGGAKGLVHGLCVALLLARIAHPFGISAKHMNTLPRGAGAGVTFIVMIVAALTLLWKAVM